MILRLAFLSILRRPARHMLLLLLLAAACAGVLGVLLVLRPGEGAQALTMLLGASLFLDGVMNLLVALLTVKIIRHQRPDVIETDEFEIK